MSRLFLAEELDSSVFAPGVELSVTGAEARHAVIVNRLRLGERVAVGNGRGPLAFGPIVAASADRLSIRAEEIRVWAEQKPELWLVQALAKGDRDELAIQAATELGVTGIVPWQAQRSVSRWEGSKAEKARQRWAGIVREASKQAVRGTVPEVVPVVSTRQLVVFGSDALLLVLDPKAPVGANALLASDTVSEVSRVFLVVGPEGGITPAELQQLADAGARRVRLGDTVLRTSTAGPAALAVLQATLGRW